mmetsp:Transcript_32972/g.48128  ORF Transcript_32972/g.48128 Transcript_32972/m.48128 type:complete len:83 (-) Transcript_32972:333-581(-)
MVIWHMHKDYKLCTTEKTIWLYLYHLPCLKMQKSMKIRGGGLIAFFSRKTSHDKMHNIDLIRRKYISIHACHCLLLMNYALP